MNVTMQCKIRLRKWSRGGKFWNFDPSCIQNYEVWERNILHSFLPRKVWYIDQVSLKSQTVGYVVWLNWHGMTHIHVIEIHSYLLMLQTLQNKLLSHLFEKKNTTFFSWNNILIKVGMLYLTYSCLHYLYSHERKLFSFFNKSEISYLSQKKHL